MRKHLSIPAILVFVSVTVSGYAQAPPDVAGRWMFAAQRAPAAQPAGPRSNFGTEFIIRQDATSVTFERGSGAQKNVEVHPLDNSEVEFKQGQSTVKSRARVQEGKVVLDLSVTGAPAADGRQYTATSTRRFWREGDALISEWVITSPNQVTSLSEYRQPPAGPPAPLVPATATLASLEWLSGVWEGQMGATHLEERWTPSGGGAMLGVSRTVSNNRMVAFEFLRIVERNGTLVYLAQPNGRAPATEFTLTRFGPTDALFENATHDYPKRISYTLAADGTLTAVIADVNGLKPEHFLFKKSR